MRDQDTAERKTNGSRNARHRRDQVAKVLEQDAKIRIDGASQRKSAAELNVPRTTLQYWLSREEGLAASPATVAFFESQDGLEFLRGFLVAAHLVMCWMGPCGIRLVGLLIELTGLGRFIANSYGAQQRISAEMQAALAEYGAEERTRLAAGMEPKKVTICEDETFLSEDLCLVAMEPVSGFILLETYAEKRDAATWDAALHEATQGLDVDVIQSTSDEAAALARHAKGLGAAHSPDLFHVQHEVGKAMALSLATREARAQQAHIRAQGELGRQVEAERVYRAKPHGPGRPPAFAKRIGEARVAEAAAEQHLKQVGEYRFLWREALHGIEQAYHPFDLSTGAPRQADRVAAELGRRFDDLERIATEVEIPQSRQAHLAKARRVLPKMVASMSFFHEEVHRRVDALNLPAEQEVLLRDNLIPAAYLQRVAGRTQDKDRRALIRKTLDELLSASLFPGSLAAALTPEQRQILEKTAYACADVFQRSSSCIEGRNGLLSQFEHAMRRLHPKKLAGLTVVHNYFAKRSDGTTAAERFFGTPPRDLFAWLLERLPLPPRPGKTDHQRKKLCLFQPT